MLSRCDIRLAALLSNLCIENEKQQFEFLQKSMWKQLRHASVRLISRPLVKVDETSYGREIISELTVRPVLRMLRAQAISAGTHMAIVPSGAKRYLFASKA